MRWTLDAADPVRLRLLRLGGASICLSRRRGGTRPAAGGSRDPAVFGGGRIGLMGIAADAALAAGGQVIGVIPASLRDAELAHSGVSELVVVDTMHDRKRVMAERSDAFAVLPGGIGTLDETFEILTWRQLRLHDRPIFLVDIAGYWQPLRALLDHIVAQHFATSLVPRLLEIVPSVSALMVALAPPAPGGKTRSDFA
jgi:uncharacterized protein (TIGR00730 family)